MESIYWVLCWACHRRCPHCYDDRFRPYVRGGRENVIAEAETRFRTIVENLPDDMTFLNTHGVRERTRLILAGGELLLDGVRERIFFPALALIRARYGHNAPRLSMQTTGDVLTPSHVEEMLARGISTIAIASIDDFHAGHAGEKKFALMDRVRAIMAPLGVKEVAIKSSGDERLKTPAQTKMQPDDPTYVFFGAQPELWIGELWPRGRAWTNGLSNATYETNFCARWSGGKNFLNYGHAGSEVAIEPDGSVYPCCLKTKAALGNLTEEKLIAILDSLKGHPAFEAINQGDPERMGEHQGWSRKRFKEAAHVIDPKGRPFANVCIGCDAYFEAHLKGELERLRAERLARRAIVQ